MPFKVCRNKKVLLQTRKFAGPPKIFSIIDHYKGRFWHTTIGDRKSSKIVRTIQNSRFLWKTTGAWL